MHLYLMQRLKRYFCFALLALPYFAFTSLYAQTSCPAPTIEVAGNSEAEGGIVICDGGTITLEATFAGTPPTDIGYQWQKDGVVDPAATNRTYSVATPGEYVVSVTGTPPGNTCTSVSSAIFTVTVGSPPETPVVKFVPQGPQCPGEEIRFSIENAVDGLQYEWTFGDGTVATSTGVNSSVTHQYDGSGTSEPFVVQVRAVDPATNCESEQMGQAEVTVRPQPLVNYREKYDFNFCESDTAAAISVTSWIYNESSSTDGIQNFIIDFGDGSPPRTVSAADFAPGDSISNVIPYDTIGSYPITITAKGSGCDAVFTRNFNVNQKPEAEIHQDKQEGTPIAPDINCLSHIFMARDSTKGFGLTREWVISKYGEQPTPGQLPDGATFTSPLFNFSSDTIAIDFPEAGVYTVQMIVNGGCGNDTVSTIAIVGYPTVQVQPLEPGCGPQTYTLQAQIDPNFGTINTGSYQWSIIPATGFTYLNGTGPTSESPEISFQPSSQPYEISFTVSNECGNVMDIPQELRQNTTQLNVFPFPAAPLVQGTQVCDGDSAILRPTGPISATRPGTYQWYEQPTGGNALAAGLEFSTPALSATGANASTTYTYYVSTFDQNGCESQTRTPVEVVVLPPISNNEISEDQQVCADTPPASLTGTAVQGGTGTYAYRWQRSVTGSDTGFAPAPGTATGQNYAFTGALDQTTWFRRIVTSGTCTGDTSNVVEITITPIITQNTITADQTICADQAPANLTGSVPAGGNPADITYRWESSPEGATTGFTPAAGDNTAPDYIFPGALSQATWFRRVVLSGGCQSISNVIEISVTPRIANNIIQEAQTVCPGQAAALLAGSTPTNTAGPPSYRWEGSTLGPTTGFAPLAGTSNERDYNPGTLSQTTWFRRIVLASSAACLPDTSNAIQVTVTPAIADNRISSDQTICLGTTPNRLREVIPTGGNTYTYLWEISTTSDTLGFGPAPGINTEPEYAPGPISQQTWFRRVITSQGCTNVSDAVVIQVIDIPESPAVTTDATACPGGRASLTASGPGGGAFEWFAQETGGNPLFVGETFETPPLTTNTTYYVQVTNGNGCTSAVRTPATVTITTPVVTVSDDVEIIQGRQTEIRATGGLSYVWSPAAGLNDPNIATPIAKPATTTTYRVTVTTAEGCVMTEEVTVTVVPAIDVPNAFTPNRDGVNEAWEIKNIQNYPEVVVEVFNRWGQRVYRSEGYPQPWDGRFNNQDLPVATYYYIIYLNPQETPVSGNVTIIR